MAESPYCHVLHSRLELGRGFSVQRLLGHILGAVLGEEVGALG